MARETAAKSLSLAHLGLETLPNELFDRVELVELDFFANALTELPDDIGNLALLERLNLGKNALRTLPAAIERLKRLSELTLTDNSLIELPVEIRALRELRQLTLVRNPGLDLGRTFEQLAPLELRDLRITIDRSARPLPESIGLLGHLKRLFIWRQNDAGAPVWTFPEAVCELAGLEELHAPATRLGALPKNISKLTKLRVIDVRSNVLDDLPDSLVELGNLRTLSLGLNPISAEAEGGDPYGSHVPNARIKALREQIPWAKILLD